MLVIRADGHREGGVLTAECLHNRWPWIGTFAPVIVLPARVAVVLFVVLDEGLAQGPPAAPVASSLVKPPGRGDADLDRLIHYGQFVEFIDNIDGSVDGRGVD